MLESAATKTLHQTNRNIQLPSRPLPPLLLPWLVARPQTHPHPTLTHAPVTMDGPGPSNDGASMEYQDAGHGLSRLRRTGIESTTACVAAWQSDPVAHGPSCTKSLGLANRTPFLRARVLPDPTRTSGEMPISRISWFPSPSAVARRYWL